MICAIFAFIAPFLHILYPKIDPNLVQEKSILSSKLDSKIISKEQYDICLEEAQDKYKVFGFKNMRVFWNIAGRNICMLIFSFILMYISFFITEREIKNIALICSFLFMGISAYFVVWTFWWESDFPKNTYYAAMIIISLVSTTTTYFLIGHFNKILKYLSNIHKLTDFIVKDVSAKYIDESQNKDYTIDVVNVIDSLDK
ncbi:hypothetical protein ACSTS3_07970 [Aquimarina muelleri]|uniref:hypothetical protein n=1 Tax=Aquimarina muelleri TaxID=279356 RepID=UPI003F683DB7